MFSRVGGDRQSSKPLSPRTCSKRLRTKKGCSTCRDRRKKCDELKPTCVSCDRLGLRCQWPSRDALRDRRERGAVDSRWSPTRANAGSCVPSSMSSTTTPNSPGPMYPSQDDKQGLVLNYPILSAGFRSSANRFLRSDREVVLFTYFYEDFLVANILPKAHADFSRMYIGDVPELRAILFACSSMQLANRYSTSPVESLQYYASAVSGLRRRLDAGELTGLEDWVLGATITLHVFETWRYDGESSCQNDFQHLLGAIQLLKLRCKTPREISNHEFDVLAAESVLFHVSTVLASSSPAIDFDVDSSLWDWLETILERPIYGNIHSPINHPVLGTNRKLNKLVFEASRMTIRAFRGSHDVSEVARLDKELKRWELPEPYETVAVENFANIEPYASVCQLYIICVRILLLWVATNVKLIPTASFESQLQQQIFKALTILNGMDRTNTDVWNFSMRWPLLILGYATNSQEYQDVIHLSLERIWETSLCGDVRRTLDRMQYTWKSAKDQSPVQVLHHIFQRVNVVAG